MHYFDTSVIVSVFSNETRTLELQEWFTRLDVNSLQLSDWTLTEFSSAISFKRRTNQLTSLQIERAKSLFDFYVDNFFQMVTIKSSDFRRAGEIAGRDDINIRAADALHLAVAETRGVTICTLDKKMHQAAIALSVPCVVP